jgi:hypothetical protein
MIDLLLINCSASKCIQGLIATQIKLEANMKMDKLEVRRSDQKLFMELRHEITHYLRPGDSNYRDRIIKIALEKFEGVTSTDLTARVTEAVESAILGKLHKGIDEQMRGYMN